MKIVIIGGGNVGVTVAKKLIYEGHNIIIIEEDEKVVKKLEDELDALVIHNNGLDINILKEAKIQNASLFLAVTNKDDINLISCYLARKLCNEEMMIIAKVDNSNLYFDKEKITPNDFGIDMIIDQNELSIQKILTLIDNPEVIEMVNYTGETQLIGIKIKKDFQFIGKSLKDIGKNNELFKKARVVAINRNENIIIPKGTDIILPRDKIFIIGSKDIVGKIIKSYFEPSIISKNIVIVGGNKIGEELAKRLIKLNKKVTIIDSNKNRCIELSKELNHVQIIYGSGTDLSSLREIEIDKSFFVCVTNEDEHNMIVSAIAEKHRASKTVCFIRNITLAPIIHSMPAIDTVLSPHLLAVGEILRFCKKGDIISVTSFSEINAETIGVLISEKISILNKPLEKIKFPDGMIIGVIIRDNKVIIPSGKNCLKLNDKVIIFILPSVYPEAEKIFLKKKFLG